MPRKYTKIELLADEVFRRKAAGETNRQIAEKFSLSIKQVKNFVYRQNRKHQLIAQGYLSRKKGRPAKDPRNADIQRNNELVELRMQVDILRNFLSEVGRM